MYPDLEKRLDEIIEALDSLESELEERAEGFQPPKFVMKEDELEEVRDAWDEACDCLEDAQGCLDTVLARLRNLKSIYY